VLLGGRMHPTIFAASVGTPVVGLTYNPKFQGFFQLLGLMHNVMDVQEFVTHERVDELSLMVDRAIRERVPLRETVDRLTREIRAFNQLLFAEQTA
jgi:polysaccharide pyruvyl transferase WcaK-like protein